ncbi:hypothetical protein [Sarcina ventriculi]|uniref:hypothetical protein n=1 Tax=Sarcina ventriculi TaxID=1267 RepID=UPI00073EADB2|nr:hypothetical protein [Sarcina ventriculi]
MNNKYHKEFTEIELNKFNFLTDDFKVLESTKKKMMTVYAYLLLRDNIETTGFKCSQAKIWELFSKKKTRKDIVGSYANFRKLMYKLIEHGFLFVERLGKVNIYYARKNFLNDSVANGVTDGVTDGNPIQSIDTTSVEVLENAQQILNNKNNYINIINNTSNDVSQNDYKNSLAYKKACEVNNADTLAPVELMKIAYKILKEKRRKSEKLISMIRKALQDKLTIARVNADKYVETVVADKIAKYEFNREMYARTITKNKNNYRLAHNKANSTFANFTQRKYDYDKLEAQLLGWDCSDDDWE